MKFPYFFMLSLIVSCGDNANFRGKPVAQGGNNTVVTPPAPIPPRNTCSKCPSTFTFDEATNSCSKKTYAPYTAEYSYVAEGSFQDHGYSASGFTLIDTYASAARPLTHFDPWVFDKRFIDTAGNPITPLAEASQAQSPIISHMEEIDVFFEPHVDNQWYSVSICHENTSQETQNYIMGIGADNLFEFRINGEYLMRSRYGTTSFNVWTMASFLLPPGRNTLNFRFSNQGGPYGYAFELYKNTPAEIVAGMSSGVGINRLLSSRDFIGQNIVSNDDLGCPADYTYDACESRCVRTETVACLEK